jgi:hypothetical protein
MKKFFLAFFIGFSIYSQVAEAAISICSSGGEITTFDTNGPPQQGCLIYSLPPNTQQEYDAAKALLETQPTRYLKILNGVLVEKSPAEKVGADDALAAQIQAKVTTDSRTGAKNSVDELSQHGVRLRAIALVLLDEINTLRQRDRDRSADVAASTSLADLKTRWAARSALNDRNLTQAKQALKDKIDAGSAD